MDENILSGKKILIVEDTTTQRLYIKHIFEKEDCLVIEAKDGKEGWEAFNKERFDLVVSDILMPNMNGYELCKLIKKTPQGLCIPVMLLTTLKSPLDVIEGIECRADNFVMKPFDEKFLLYRAKDLINTRSLRNDLNFSVDEDVDISIPIFKNGMSRSIHPDRVSSLDLLFSVYENAITTNQKLTTMFAKLEALNASLKDEKEKFNNLLKVILPEETLLELKKNGVVSPKLFKNVTILFADIEGFSTYCENKPVDEVTFYLQKLITRFEEISNEYGIRKIKTIGDEYMAAGGLFSETKNIALQTVKCGLKMIEATKEISPGWRIRIGVHLGKVIGGVIGNQQYAFDIWGKDVNVASRIEGKAEANEVWVSEALWDQIKFYCQEKESKQVFLKGCGDYNIYGIESTLEV